MERHTIIAATFTAIAFITACGHATTTKRPWLTITTLVAGFLSGVGIHYYLNQDSWHQNLPKAELEIYED